MIFLDEIKYNYLYKKKFYLPIDEKDKKHNSLIYLLTPNYLSSINVLNNPLLINKKYFESYYIEKNVMHYINEGYLYEDNTPMLASPKLSKPQLSNDDAGNINSQQIGSSSSTRALKMRIKKAKYNLNKMGDNERNSVGINNSSKETNESNNVTKEDINILKNIILDLHPELNKISENPNITNFEKIDNNVITNVDLKEGLDVTNVLFYMKDNLPVSSNGNLQLKGEKIYTVSNIRSGERLVFDKALIESFILECYSFNESKIDKKLYFISEKNLDGKTIYPKVPQNYLTKNGYENNSIKRICFSTSIDKCLIALSQNCKNKEYYVYEPDNYTNLNIQYPTKSEVPDCMITGEVWVKNSVKLKQVSKIKVVDDGTNEYTYTYGDNKSATLYDWKWETLKESSDYIGLMKEDCIINKSYSRFKIDEKTDVLQLFNDDILEEDSKYNIQIKRILYNERMKNNKEVFGVYKEVKSEVPYIRYAFIDINKYRNKNLFVDLYHYNQSFLRNNIFKLDKGIDLYLDFLNRLILDSRFTEKGYSKKTIFVPVSDWNQNDLDIFNFRDYINPISLICRLLRTNPNKLQTFKDIDFVFIGKKRYFKCDISKLETKDLILFKKNINKIIINDSSNTSTEEIEVDDNSESKKAIIANIVDKIEDTQNIKVNNLTGDDSNISKKELIDKIEKAASVSSNTDDALDALEKDNENLQAILDDLASEESDTIKINTSRASRIIDLQSKYKEKQIKGKSIKELLNNKEETIPEVKLELDTVNDEWEKLKYVNFESTYNIDEDIAQILYFFSERTVPMSIRDIKVEDTSTSEDLKETYIVDLEDINGTRSKLKFDVPIMKDDKFMMLRGNDKTINGQLTLIPVIKTDEDTVQVVSNYKKIFIRRYGTTIGKSTSVTDRIIKTFKKFDKFNVTYGNNNMICSKYELPIDYIDLASVYNKIETSKFIIYFNQDEIRSSYNIDDKLGLPIAYNKANKEVLYYDGNSTPLCSTLILSMLVTSDSNFLDIYEKTSMSSKYTYSKASILNTEIPLIVIMAYNEGLIKAMNKGNIKYEISEKRSKASDSIDVIKFKDAYLSYDIDYNSSLLMNGLKECNTEDYSIKDINSKSMYLDFLEIFGTRIVADGLDNFYDLMIDPITEEVLEHYKLPTDYIEVLAYANLLLADNKYIRHTDMSGRRYRSNELIAGYVYQSLAEAYGSYRTELKKKKKGTMTMKQTEVLDKILVDPTCSDLSLLNPILDAESANTVSYKGLVGMNSDRSYSLDKRTYDDSMLNVLGLSTGFAGNVGVTRQATIDMNIEGKRGYIKTINNDTDQFNTAKTFTVTEALTPYGVTRDDPFRSAMTFIQTSKHGMRIKKGDPLLVSNGSDQALPYLTSNSFSFKAKDNGKVIEKTEEYMIVEYINGEKDFVDLRENVKKNSNGGFFLTIKLSSELKTGNKIKKGDIIAYDKLSYSDSVGYSDNLSYNIGSLCKVAILNTDEGFEDSCIISEYISDAMASDVVIQKDVMLSKNTNIYHMVKKGQPIQEGDSLLTFQNAYDDQDVNILLKNLVDDEDEISDLGRIPIKSKVTGVVQDIKIYRTVEKEELSDSLKKKINEYEKPLNDLKKVMKKYDINSSNKIDATYTLERTGKLKNVYDGVLIEFYLKYEDKMSIGDKLVFYSAVKGVVKEIFPEGKEPYTDFRPDEKIHAFVSQGSILARMVGSVLVNMGINKGLIELDRKVKTMAGIPYKNLDEM